MNKKKILVFHFDKVTSYPPVISLIQNLLHNGHKVCIISFNSTALPKVTLKNKNLSTIDISFDGNKNLIATLKRKMFLYKKLQTIVKGKMQHYDVLWTTTDLSVRVLGKLVLNYKHVMQLMELEEKMPLFRMGSHFSYPIDLYARNAWKVVVPEINRAYIQKAWWHLSKTPYVLPNKPYMLNYPLKNGKDENVQKYFRDNRKIILYLGFIGPDRKLEEFAEAVQKLGTDKFALYIIGKIGNNYKEKFTHFLNKYNFVNYLGYYNAPDHLAFVKKAYIGILPYYINNNYTNLSPLNALYCAPNKLFEYAGFSVPMVGTDVLGLRIPFEQYQIGVCAEKLSASHIASAILQVDRRHTEMVGNCKTFFDSVNLDNIVEKILSD